MESDLGKLFIGGISWDTDEDRLKDYFEAYGEVVEVVIMRDRTTGRARGFGFVVFVDPAVAEKVVREKHTIDGRTVEAKKAVPRDDNHIISRNNHSNQGSPGGYGVRMDGRLNPVVSGRSAFSPIGSPAYGMNMSLEPGLSPGFGGSSSFSNNLGYGRTLSLSHGGNSNSSANVAPAVTYTGSGNGSFGVFGDSSATWGSSPVLGQGGGIASGYSSNTGYGGGENNYRLGATGLGRNIGPVGAATSPFVSSTGNSERSYGDLYSASSRFGDAPWQSASPVINDSGSFDYGLGTAAESTVKSSEGYVGSYNIANRQANRGIAA
ncbi:Heterogeneous nuclear ribonucleoprotein 1 [Heracleum sosnowskyi]|uniref:Heterogeneous nuclear ribonucleoprotein 1 n=1 Tax=Heracleum sosnowskyi TaxID=360622 RepID=A0AAD8J5W2_9APIA|nr:Heterogeneous nuclear ribonucleoprotein 1 [Heracleum sosnowskyi]